MSKQIQTKTFRITSDPTSSVASNGSPYIKWGAVDSEHKKIYLYYFGSERKGPEFERLKEYEIGVSPFGDNWVIERDVDGPIHVMKILTEDPDDDDLEDVLPRHKDISLITAAELQEDPPLSTRETAVANFRLYEYIMNSIIGAEDYAVVNGRRFLTKTGFKKLAMAFNISDPDVEIQWLSDTEVQVRATAVAPNGRSSTDYAICSMDEVFGAKTRHNLLTKAITRAKNRAISNLVGCGLVSFEEVSS